MKKFLKISWILFLGLIGCLVVFNIVHEIDVNHITKGNDPSPFSKEVGRPLYLGLAPKMVNVHYYEITDQQLAELDKLKDFSWNQCHAIHSGGDCLLYYWKDKSKIPSQYKLIVDGFNYDAFYSRKVHGDEEVVKFIIKVDGNYQDYDSIKSSKKQNLN